MMLRNAAVHVSYGIALVAMNYPGGADALDAEVLRGLTLHWAFVREIGLRIRETEEAFEYTVHALARAAEAYDDGTGLHILRVSEYSTLLAGYTGMPAEFVKAIHVQAQMHDVGKLHVPPEILQKPARLTPEEHEIFKSHTTSGAKILGDHPRLKLAASIALTHHERWDGTGYPSGLRGEAIPIEGRILAIADVYDALRAERRYKQGMDHEEARGVLLRGDGRVMPSHFDPEMLAAFERIADRFDDVYRAIPT
jgi:HD-GYP domain-containing protein (c-di-GMP phosphodiesterase class II)